MVRKIRDDALLFVLTTSVSFIFYLLTLAPGITLMDAGDLIMGAGTLGIPHPPGYPTFTMLGFLFTKLLPFLETATAVNVFNALCGAMATGLLALILQELFQKRWLAVWGALALALTASMWELSVTTEVYALNLFFNNLLWWLMLRVRATRDVKVFYAFCAVVGLSLTDSYPLILLSGLGLILAFPADTFQVKKLLKGALFALIGLLPYLYIVIQASRIDRLSYAFFDIPSWGDILPFILRSQYSFLDSKASSGFDKILVFKELLTNLAKDFALVSPLVAWGLYKAFRERFFLRWPLLVATLTSSVLLYLLLGTTPDVDSFVQFYEYVLPTLTYLVIFAAYGIDALTRFERIPLRALQGALGLALISEVVLGYTEANYNDSQSVETWGEALLQSLPQNSHLLFCADEAFPIQYLQIVKGVRPDLKLYSNFFGAGKRYFYRRGPELRSTLGAAITVESLLENSNAPVFVTHCGARYLSEGKQAVLKGLTYQIVAPSSLEVPMQNLAAESIKPLLTKIKSGAPLEDHWVDLMRERAARMLLVYAMKQGWMTLAEIEDFSRKLGFAGQMHFEAALDAELAYAGDVDLAFERFRKLDANRFGDADEDDVAVYCRMLLMQNDVKTAQSVCRWPARNRSLACNADALYNLGRAYWSEKEKSLSYLREAVKCNPGIELIRKSLEERQATP